MAIPPTYHDSDADDEYERSIITSPIIPTDDENSPTDTDPPSTEPTPTAFGHHVELGKLSPANTIVGWSTGQCADYISDLGLSQYCGYFVGMSTAEGIYLNIMNHVLTAVKITRLSAKH